VLHGERGRRWTLVVYTPRCCVRRGNAAALKGDAVEGAHLDARYQVSRGTDQLAMEYCMHVTYQ